ncbi:MAG: hypothetical protein ACQES7_04215 [Pseudomonadota bacterium]
MSTDVNKFLVHLDGGVFEEQLSEVLSCVAAGVVDHNRVGEVSMKFKVKPIGKGHQVTIEHTLQYKQPTSRGTLSEDNTTATPMHVGTKGAMSFFPEDQGQLLGMDGTAPAKEPYPNVRKGE